MSEDTILLTGYGVVACSACGVTVTGEVSDRYDAGYLLSRNLADYHGWRIYASRTRRHYCPDCAPKPGHRMRLVGGVER